MQLCRLPDERPGEDADVDGRPQICVVLSLLQSSDIGFCGIEDHSFGHSSRQCDLDFNIEFASESVFGECVEAIRTFCGSDLLMHDVWQKTNKDPCESSIMCGCKYA